MLGTLSLSDALSLCRPYERDRHPWLGEGDAALDQPDAASSVRSAHKQGWASGGSTGPLRTEFGQLALNVLLTACDELPRAAPMQREVGPCASGSVPTRMAKDSTVVTTLA